MINLDAPIKAAPKTGLVPVGDYEVKVLSVDDWKPTTKDIYVNVTDGRGRIVRGDDGKPVKELVKGHTFYTADVVLEITDGDYAGSRLYTSLTTHPNASFITENFVRAVGLIGVPLRDVPAKAVDLTLTVGVVHDSYEKKTVDNDTGLETVEVKQKAKVTSFK